jgi:hypothetical protein
MKVKNCPNCKQENSYEYHIMMEYDFHFNHDVIDDVYWLCNKCGHTVVKTEDQIKQMNEARELKLLCQKNAMQALREKKRNSELVKVEVWVYPNHVAQIKQYDLSEKIEKKKTGRPAKN